MAGPASCGAAWTGAWMAAWAAHGRACVGCAGCAASRLVGPRLLESRHAGPWPEIAGGLASSGGGEGGAGEGGRGGGGAWGPICAAASVRVVVVWGVRSCGVVRDACACAGVYLIHLENTGFGRVRRAVTAAARKGAAGGGALPPCARRTDYAARAVAAVRGGFNGPSHSTLSTLRLVRRSWVVLWSSLSTRQLPAVSYLGLSVWAAHLRLIGTVTLWAAFSK